jgi:hypothetical protein
VDGLQVFSPESALIDCSTNFFNHNSTDVRGTHHYCGASGRSLPKHRARSHRG